MLNWYVLRRGSSFVIAHIDHQGALLWHEAGWELGTQPFDTLEEAEQEKQRWQQQFAQLHEVNRKPPQSERSSAREKHRR